MATQRSSRQAISNLTTLPNVVDVQMRVATYSTPKIFFVGSERREVTSAVEITVRTSSPIPARALSPVIYVGDSPVIEMEVTGRNEYKFYALEPTRLQQGAAIALGWSGRAADRRPGAANLAERVATRFRYQIGGGGSQVA
ncbi:MAG: hypothetical protein IPK82_40345 [Polyangiaceae bacterium]|nr:hypothetical protein [Polyangiaceae bacterium]